MSDQRIDKKLDIIVDRLGKIDVTLAEQHISLKEHMRRSDSLEKHVSLVEKEVSFVQKRMYYLDGALKVLVSLGFVAGSITAVLRLMKGLG